MLIAVQAAFQHHAFRQPSIRYTCWMAKCTFVVIAEVELQILWPEIYL